MGSHRAAVSFRLTHMALWLSLGIAVAAFLAAGGVVLHASGSSRRAAPEHAADAEEPSVPVKRRRRVVRTSAPPPAPPLPESLPSDAAPAQEVAFDQLISLIEANLETGNLALAAQYLEELRARFMDNPPAVYFAHKLQLGEKLHDASMRTEALEQLVRLEPDEHAHVLKLVEALLDVERIADAERLLDEALAMRPDELDALRLLAKLYRKADRHEEAVALKQRIHALEQDMRLRGELPPDTESYAPAPPPAEPPAV